MSTSCVTDVARGAMKRPGRRSVDKAEAASGPSTLARSAPEDAPFPYHKSHLPPPYKMLQCCMQPCLRKLPLLQLQQNLIYELGWL
eukprot:5975380-Amphidinium_carterae.1